MKGRACSAEFMRRIEKLARQAGWTPEDKRRGAKKSVVEALSHHLCLQRRTIYQVLQALSLRDIAVNSTNGEAIHPSLLCLAATAGEEAAEVIELALAEEWTDKQVREEVKRRKAAKRASAQPPYAGPALDLRVVSMPDLLNSLTEVDAIITDPPYGADAVPLYAELARQAKRALAPRGILAVMCGQSYLPEILPVMASLMPYRWTLAYLTPGGQSPQIWPRKVNTFWKPILLFGASEEWIGDVIKSDINDNDKRFHHWGQSESGMARVVERLTHPGQLVCDPFLGAGTTGVVALGLGRRFIGGDVDSAAVMIARHRMEGRAENVKL